MPAAAGSCSLAVLCAAQAQAGSPRSQPLGWAHTLHSARLYLGHYSWQGFSTPATAFAGLCCETTQTILSRGNLTFLLFKGTIPFAFLTREQPVLSPPAQGGADTAQ